MNFYKVLGAACASFIYLCSANGATFSAIDRGWYDSHGTHITANDNTVTGLCCGGTVEEYRSYFLFDLSSLNETVRSASIKLEVEGYWSDDNIETATIWNVASFNRSNLDAENGNGTGASIFADLGSAQMYGSISIDTPGNEYTTYLTGTHIFDIILNGAAIADINASAGQLFAIGIRLDEISPTYGYPYYEEWVRFSIAEEPRTHLLVTSTVPLPAAFWLFGSGVLGLIGIPLRRAP